jgi:hypothetical protein
MDRVAGEVSKKRIYVPPHPTEDGMVSGYWRNDPRRKRLAGMVTTRTRANARADDPPDTIYAETPPDNDSIGEYRPEVAALAERIKELGGEPILNAPLGFMPDMLADNKVFGMTIGNTTFEADSDLQAGLTEYQVNKVIAPHLEDVLHLLDGGRRRPVTFYSTDDSEEDVLDDVFGGTSLQGLAQGIYYPDNGRIAVRDSYVEKWDQHTLVHEAAHAWNHEQMPKASLWGHLSRIKIAREKWLEDNPKHVSTPLPYSMWDYGATSNEGEFIADFVAYAVADPRLFGRGLAFADIDQWVAEQDVGKILGREYSIDDQIERNDFMYVNKSDDDVPAEVIVAEGQHIGAAVHQYLEGLEVEEASANLDVFEKKRIYVPAHPGKHGTVNGYWREDPRDKKSFFQRIKPVFAGTKTVKKKPVPVEALELHLDAFPETTQKAILKKWQDTTGKTPEEARANIRAVFAEAIKDEEARQGGLVWYADAFNEAAQLQYDYGIDFDSAVAMLAAISPGTKWENNLTGPAMVMEGIHDYPNMDAKRLAKKISDDAHLAAGRGRAGIEKAIRIARGEDFDEVLRGPKERSFFNNIRDPYNIRGLNDVTIDQHMMNVAYGGLIPGPQGVIVDVDRGKIDKRTDSEEWVMPADWDVVNPPDAEVKVFQNAINRMSGTPSINNRRVGVLPIMADEVRAIAEEEGLEPNQVQAMIWIWWKNHHPITDKRGASTEAIKATADHYRPKNDEEFAEAHERWIEAKKKGKGGVR